MTSGDERAATHRPHSRVEHLIGLCGGVVGAPSDGFEVCAVLRKQLFAAFGGSVDEGIVVGSDQLAGPRVGGAVDEDGIDVRRSGEVDDRPDDRAVVLGGYLVEIEHDDVGFLSRG